MKNKKPKPQGCACYGVNSIHPCFCALSDEKLTKNLGKIKKELIKPLPNNINLFELKKVLAFSDKYEISIQFWHEQISVYIAKDGIDLADFGGGFEFAIGEAVKYLKRINPSKQRINGLNY